MRLKLPVEKEITIPHRRPRLEVRAHLEGVAEKARLRTICYVNEDAPNPPLMRPTEAGSDWHLLVNRWTAQ